MIRPATTPNSMNSATSASTATNHREHGRGERKRTASLLKIRFNQVSLLHRNFQPNLPTLLPYERKQTSQRRAFHFPRIKGLRKKIWPPTSASSKSSASLSSSPLRIAANARLRINRRCVAKLDVLARSQKCRDAPTSARIQQRRRTPHRWRPPPVIEELSARKASASFQRSLFDPVASNSLNHRPNMAASPPIFAKPR